MIISTTFLPNDLYSLLTLYNKLQENNASVICRTGVVYGWFALDPEAAQRKVNHMLRLPISHKFELYMGECFTGITADSEESMVSFVKGLLFAACTEAVGLDFDEEEIERFIKDQESRQQNEEEIAENRT